MPQYTAAQLRNTWKPVMSRLGFQVAESRFVKGYGPIKHSVILQRLQRSRDVLVKLFVCVIDPFEPNEALKARVCLSAYLHNDGVRFQPKHWDENELAGSAEVFEQYGVAFFKQFQEVGNLIAITQAAQAEFQTPEAHLRGPVAAPSDPVAREFLSSLPRRRLGPLPANEELLALLYWHCGDLGRAIEHVHQYLRLLPGNEKMKGRLEAMVRPVL